MKVCISRRWLLPAFVIAVLLAATPLAVLELVRTGEIYLFSPRFVEEMFARLSGPGRMRFIFQPAAAIVLGVRDGTKDARAGSLPFLSALVFHRERRPGLLRAALESLRNLVAIAILLDVVSQFLMFRVIHPGAALLLGPVLISVPYALSRALANRIARWRGARLSSAHAS
jgi:hypothetical protein